MIISNIQLLHNKINLKSPYDLSFASIEYVDSVVVQMTFDNNAVGIGEAVPLPGYSEETCDSLIADIGNTANNMIGMAADEVVEFVSTSLPDSHFARSALCVAKEMALKEIDWVSNINIPLVAPMASSMSSEQTLNKAQQLIDGGYTTLKLKVGRNIEADIKTVSTLLNELQGGIKLRIDANQAYSEIDARQLLNVMDHSNAAIIEVVEQPYGIPDWKKFAALTAEYPEVPLMLDESIFDLQDLEKAVTVGAQYIKLKLFKHRGTDEMLAIASKANELGLGVVLGNGVSTDLGNIIEASLYNTGLFMGAFEGNGFEKLTHCVLKKPPQSQHGNILWTSDCDLKEMEIQLEEGYSMMGQWGENNNGS